MKRSMAFMMGLLMSAGTICLSACGDKTDNVVQADSYKITVACQTEQGEEEVLRILKARYEELYTDREIEVKTFSGEGFEQYMLGIAANPSSSPNIIWTSDTLHSQWDEYFTDLRPYYEASEETDYSFYYETMLDTAATNGYFKPTKNYKGAFRSNDLDTADGYEDYKNHSEYGLYYAPRDYNKPAVLCNTYLFAELDKEYEAQYKATEGVSEMPADYQSTTDRLAAIVGGTDWDELQDLYAFANLVATRISYVVDNPSSTKNGKAWAQKRALNLFLDWEPTYTTIMNELDVDLLADDGSLQLEQATNAFESIHEALFPSKTDADKNTAKYLCSLGEDSGFSKGYVFMTVCSRPVVLGYGNTFKGTYGSTSLEAIRLPVEYIAAGNSGYAISNIWEGKGVKVNDVYKSYTELSWDFIKFIITEEGQELAGSTGLNIPVLKNLYDAESNGGKVPAWRKVESLGAMDNEAWVAGKELRQDLFYIYQPQKRNTFRQEIKSFFVNLQRSNYGEGSLAELVEAVGRNYANQKPSEYVLNK